MHISSLRVENYKSFYNSHNIHFTPGFNIIVGKNNAGKTALVEAFSLRALNKSHRSLVTIPVQGASSINNSRVHVSFTINRDEIINTLINRLDNFFIRVPSSYNIDNAINSFTSSILPTHVIRGVYDGAAQQFVEVQSDVPTFGEPIRLGASYGVLEILPDRVQQLMTSGATATSVNHAQVFDWKIAETIRQGIYAFKAERLNVAVSPFGMNRELAPNAANLPEVLNILQGNMHRFRRFNQLVTTIFPDIQQITVQPTYSNQVEIFVWTVDPDTERTDLATSLSESGTGVGQVLAILYVVLSSEYPRTIIIDEPQSFLHPGAARKLIEILKQYQQHQFIITTHSSTAVTAASPRTLLLLRKQDAESVIESLDVSQTQQLRIFLSEIGARLSDVFGADNVLWVEGQTEELCFPLIWERVVQKPLLGTQIIGVTQTGDLEGKHARKVFEVYDQLSSRPSLLPPAIGFIFDQEGRSEQERVALARRSQNKVVFLPRRMYENYLLNPEAIAMVTSSIEGFRDTPVMAEEVQQWLERNRWDSKYVGSIPDGLKDIATWLEVVHGAKILTGLFSELSEKRVGYDKIAYGVSLTQWLVEHAPHELAEVAELLRDILTQIES